LLPQENMIHYKNLNPSVWVKMPSSVLFLNKSANT